MRRQFLWMLLCLLAAGGTGCGRKSPLDYWFVDSLVKVFPDDPQGAGTVPAEFAAARGAHVSVQLALRAPHAVGDLYADALPLTGPGIPIDTVRVRHVEYVVVTSNTENTPESELIRKAPALFPDALLEGFPISVKKDQTSSIWVTVSVPDGQVPGEYQGILRLRQGRDVLADVPYVLRISPAVVPRRIPLAVDNYFNLSDHHIRQFYGVAQYSDEWWGMMGNIASFLGSYRQTTIGAHAVDLVVAEAAGGQIRYDFRNFERFVETFRSAGVDGAIDGGNLLWRERRANAPVLVRAWIVEGGRTVLRNLPFRDPQAQHFLNTFLPALYQRLEARGWADTYLQGILDEPHEGETEPFVETAALVRRWMPKARTIEPVGAKQDLSFMEKTTDIWVPCLGSFDDKLDMLEQHAKRGGELWYYTCLSPRGRYPNRFIDYSLTKVRVLHWINFKYGFRGFLHWGGNYWGPEPFKDTQPVINEGRTYLPPGDAYITYPNRLRRSLDSSIRLEQMREGIEDFGLLEELRRNDAGRAQRLADEVVRSFVDYTRDPVRFRETQGRLLASF